MYQLKPIGIVHSPFKRREDVPTRGSTRYEATGEIEIFKEYEDGLKDIDGFSHIVALWILHESKGYNLLVEPVAYKGSRGVFATCHPDRPNPIGLTVVELLGRDKNMLRVKGIDMTDRSPVVDLKPYVSSYAIKDVRLGWIQTAERR